jgi:AbrB family looped-hinge helix DNA binding protein
MTSATSRVTSQNQISIPAEVRRRFRITPGTELVWEERDGVLVVRPKRFTLDDLRALCAGRSVVRFGPSMAAVDTNVLVRLLMEDDEEQARAARAFQRAHGPLFVSHVVLAELAWVLSSAYDFPRERVGAVVEMLVDTDGITLEEPNVVRAALEASRASRADFPDCLILAVAQSAAAVPLATFDKKLARVTGARRIGPR